jgi:hypothetical protein
MTDREIRRRLVWASVVLVSALTFAASYFVVARVELPRQNATPVASPQSIPTPEQVASPSPPFRGLVPASARRRVVTVRRTRAS